MPRYEEKAPPTIKTIDTDDLTGVSCRLLWKSAPNAEPGDPPVPLLQFVMPDGTHFVSESPSREVLDALAADLDAVVSARGDFEVKP